MEARAENNTLWRRRIGGIAFVSGTAIGGGMLALPIAGAPAGLIPSCLCCVLSWIAMTFTAFLMLECHLAVGHNTTLISMSKHSLGKAGEVITWSLYLMLLYALAAAYIAEIDSVATSVLGHFYEQRVSGVITPLFLVLIIGLIAHKGIKSVDILNRGLLLAALVAYLLLLVTVLPAIGAKEISRTFFAYAPISLPFLVTAFGFHIIIPSLCRYFLNDVPSIKLSIGIGSGISLVVYLLWQLAILGAIPLLGHHGLLQVLNNQDPLTALTQAIQAATASASVARIAKIFTFLAVMTSLFGVLLSLWDFLTDGLAVEGRRLGKTAISCCCLLPPLGFVWLYPRAFMLVLGYAGAIVAVLLGLLPIAMCWSFRYKQKKTRQYQVRGGKTALVVTALFFLVVIVLEALSHPLSVRLLLQLT